jgi:hypothetical protein
LREREIDVTGRQVGERRALRSCKRDAVDADLDSVILVTPFAAQSLASEAFIRREAFSTSGKAFADAGAEQLHAGARARRFDDRGSKARIRASDALRNCLAKG